MQNQHDYVTEAFYTNYPGFLVKSFWLAEHLFNHFIKRDIVVV